MIPFNIVVVPLIIDLWPSNSGFEICNKGNDIFPRAKVCDPV